MNQRETHLAVLPGDSDDPSDQQRVILVHCQDKSGRSQIELRQQFWGEGVGWFTQSTVSLEPNQIGQLRSALGGQPQIRATLQFEDSTNLGKSPGFTPRVVHAESA